MARKRKDPLGAFNDALSQLGLGGSEGESSVVDIDSVDSIIDTPNDDVTTIEEPAVTAEENKEDPAAHEDNSEVPENILTNNMSPESTEDPVEQEEEESAEVDEEPAPGEAAQIGAFFDAFAEANGWSVDADEKPQSVEQLVDYIKDVVEQNSQPSYADDRIAQLDQYVKNGGRFEDFYQVQQQAMSYDGLNMEDESNQKAVVRDYYRLQGMNDEQINRKIERYEDAGMLEDEATDAVSYLKQYEAARAQQAAQQQEALARAQQEQAYQFVQDLTNGINSLSSIRGITVPKEDRKALYDYITKTDADGLTQYQKDFSANQVNSLIESAYFTMKGDALLGEAKRSGQTSAASKLRNMLRHQSKNHSSYNISDEKPAPAWEIASRYL